MSGLRGRTASAAGVVGLFVGLVIAMGWHVFVSPQIDLDRPAGLEPSSVSIVGYLLEYYEPAPAWLPTVVVFPVITAVLFAGLGFFGAPIVSQRRRTPESLGSISSAAGGVVGLSAAFWAHISPPTYIGLTDRRPFRLALTSEWHLWGILPLVGVIAAAVLSVSAAAVLRRRL
ncbi:MAG: hypothetical protein WBQ44_11440 [Rhodococcus sp. (in: high G+C Gram-positive bacteria)]